jgi:DNA-binding MarR family transcriptional regulator
LDRPNSQPASRVQILSGYHDTAVRVTLQLQLRDLGSVPLLISKRYYMEEVIMSARETAELRLQVGRLVQAEGYDGELSPAQWMALRFFARANPFSRTPSAFAEFQATTRGTATQAIKALEADGYLVRQPCKTGGRSVSLRLTSKGKKALTRDPFEVLVRAVDSLDKTERTAMRPALHQVLSTLATSGAHRRTGVCQDCTRFGREMSGNLPHGLLGR